MLPLLLFNNISPQGRRELAPNFEVNHLKNMDWFLEIVWIFTWFPKWGKSVYWCLLGYPTSFFLWFANGGDSPKVWLEFLLIQVESARNGEMLLWFKAIVLETFCVDIGTVYVGYGTSMVLYVWYSYIVCVWLYVLLNVFMILCLFQNRISVQGFIRSASKGNVMNDISPKGTGSLE